MDAAEARARLTAHTPSRGRQHSPVDVVLLVLVPILLFAGPVLASTSVVGVVMAVVAMFAVVTMPAVRYGRPDEPVVPRSAAWWAVATGVTSMVVAVSLWREPAVADVAMVVLMALMPVLLFVVLLCVMYRRRPLG